MYKGWRFPCGGNLFVWNEWGKDRFLGIRKVINKNEVEIDNKVVLVKRSLLQLSCSCGRGCKPIKCTIVVENKVKEK